jgi:hypothetical protein
MYKRYANSQLNMWDPHVGPIDSIGNLKKRCDNKCIEKRNDIHLKFVS